MLEYIVKGYVAFCLLVQTEQIIKIIYKDVFLCKAKIRHKVISLLIIALILGTSFYVMGLIFNILVDLIS